MANLASTYRNQGRWKEAEELQAKELKVCSRVLGEEHPDTLISMDNLASIWKDQGRDEEAIKLMTECIRLRMQVLGADHPSTRSSGGRLHNWNQGGLDIHYTLLRRYKYNKFSKVPAHIRRGL
jgi:hypothetical protein